ncbi:hypothetical protein D1818_21910 [Aquimarina sp. BL5]|uniref:hypothetical protein n=1 Tax=Aquimarina sp. BL5 TaxID=1714860 RepID=UPI000E5254EC|nr:hypothetical protein [Aquimarina sp. BL5]AXT53352.1 hypothetical protein D1818_21910 [Aquimarina sp. BL5]RKN06187.1 hypothetical protein D7036_09370 [Aquimarina sp. BL5]
MKTTNKLFLFIVLLVSFFNTNKMDAQRDFRFRDIYARGHTYYHAFEGKNKNGTAYIQARDKSNRSNIAMQLRTQINGNIRNALRINPDGNTSIQRNLSIYGTIDIRGNAFAKGGLFLSAKEGYGQSGTTFLEAKDNSGSSSIGLQLRSQNNGAFVDAFKINPDGNIGIGTAAPQQKLHVNGNTLITGDTKINGTTNFDDTVTLTKGMNIRGDITSYDTFNVSGTLNFANTDISQQITINKGLNLRLTNIPDSHFSVKNAFGADALYIDTDGKIAIGSISNESLTEQLHVDGRIKAVGFIADASSFPDYVFAEDYELTPLAVIKAHTAQHHSLPGMPTEEEVVANGLDLKKVTTISVEKIEELYLHAIKQQELIKKQQDENDTMKKMILQLQQRLNILEQNTSKN